MLKPTLTSELHWFVERNKNGFVVTPKDSEELRDMIFESSNPAECSLCVSAAINLVLQEIETIIVAHIEREDSDETRVQ